MLYYISVAGRRVDWRQVGFFVAYRRRWRAQKADLRRRTCREKQTCARNQPLSATNLCQGRALFVTMWVWIHPKLGILPTVRALHIPCMYCKTVFYGRIRVHTSRKSADRVIFDGVCTRNRLFSEVQPYIRGMCLAGSNCTYEVCAWRGPTVHTRYVLGEVQPHIRGMCLAGSNCTYEVCAWRGPTAHTRYVLPPPYRQVSKHVLLTLILES